MTPIHEAEEAAGLMLLVMLILLCLVLIPLTGGHLTKLGELRIRGAFALYGALAVAVAISLIWPRGARFLHIALNLAIYAVVLAVVGLNHRLAGAKVVGVGTLANVVAMAANGGIMPATARALRTAGLSTDSGRFLNSTVVRHARLAWLGDVFAIPHRIPGANVFSVGDVIVAVGGGITLFAVTGASLPTRGRRRRQNARSDAVAQGTSIESTK